MEITNKLPLIELSNLTRLMVGEVVQLLRDKQSTVGFAESCTGGLLSSLFTQVPGVSDVFSGSVVSYANSVKQNVLGVSEDTLKQVGAVSSKCAEEMASGAKKALNVNIAVAITGIAGPSGGSPDKPVGTVFIGLVGTKGDGSGIKTKVFHHQMDSASTREQIQWMSCLKAVEHLKSFLEEN